MTSIRVRVYGLWVNSEKEVLLSDERHGEMNFTKFPGGGLELGEGVAETLIREFLEECNIRIDRFELLHVSEQVVFSMFDGSQVIGIYYRVFSDDAFGKAIKSKVFDFDGNSLQSFRWVPVNELTSDDLTFEMDQVAWENIRERLI